MQHDEIGVVRQFNRTVTQRIGALDEDYLARSRPLGASRLLWEISDHGTDTRTLRTRLELDSGYLSRLLRRLESERLITVEPDSTDQRLRTVQLTKAGRTERAALDRRSDELAWSLLEPLDEARRAALVAAMTTVERLLTAASVGIGIEDPTSADATWCIQSYFAELDRRFTAGFDPGKALSLDAAELIEPAGLLLLARLRGEPIGCGALKFHGTHPAEIKRMWVSSRARGLGVGRRLLADLERQASSRGVTTVHLETNRTLTEAIALYRSSGYQEVSAFNDEPYGDHWFEKRLP
jgi:DNA-binding MarR family transcriptional regulator/GNAT superfamily N-acetyltransferase